MHRRPEPRKTPSQSSRNGTQRVHTAAREDEITQPKTPPERGFPLVGETGFEPATARPPAGCATRLRHSPWCSDDNRPPGCGGAGRAACQRPAAEAPGGVRRRAASGAKRATGIEPALEAWKASVQPQHFARGCEGDLSPWGRPPARGGGAVLGGHLAVAHEVRRGPGAEPVVEAAVEGDDRAGERGAERGGEQGDEPAVLL